MPELVEPTKDNPVSETDLTIQRKETVTTEPGVTVTKTSSVPADRTWFGSLFASDDYRADSIILCGIVALVAGIMFQACAMLFPWMAVAWNPINYGGMVTAILGGLGVGKGVRSYLSGGNAPAPPPLPNTVPPPVVPSAIPSR